jgi:hypothetical protein
MIAEAHGFFASAQRSVPQLPHRTLKRDPAEQIQCATAEAIVTYIGPATTATSREGLTAAAAFTNLTTARNGVVITAK